MERRIRPRVPGPCSMSRALRPDLASPPWTHSVAEVRATPEEPSLKVLTQW